MPGLSSSKVYLLNNVGFFCCFFFLSYNVVFCPVSSVLNLRKWCGRAHLVELFAGVHRTLGVRCSPDKLEMVAQVCQPSTPEEEAGRSALQGHSQGHRKFKASLCYRRSCFKKQQLRKLLTDLFPFTLVCACSISRCECEDIQGVTRHSPRGQVHDADRSVSLYRQWLLLHRVSVLCGLGTVSICPGRFLVLGVVRV